MRIFIAAKRRAEADELASRIPGSQVLLTPTAEDQLLAFASGGITTLIGVGGFAVCGYRLPADTAMFIGPGWSEAETFQLRARISRLTPTETQPRALAIGPGTLTGLRDRLGMPIKVGDTLEFDPQEWGGECRFTITWEDGELQHPGSTSDLTQFCTVVETWDGRVL